MTEGHAAVKPAPAFDCAFCGQRIGKDRTHYLIGGTRVVCPRCLGKPVPSTPRCSQTAPSAGMTYWTTRAQAAPAQALPRTSDCGLDRRGSGDRQAAGAQTAGGPMDRPIGPL